MTKLAIFIDGSNLHGCVGRVTDIHREGKKLKDNEYYMVDFEKLKAYLLKDNSGVLVRTYYATSVTYEDFGKKKNFFAKLNTLGYKIDVKIRKDGCKEKGVDMAIAMEMLISAYSNIYDEAILVAGDADYCQLIKEVQRLGKRVGLASFGLSSGLSINLMNEKDFYIDLMKSNILMKQQGHLKDPQNA